MMIWVDRRQNYHIQTTKNNEDKHLEKPISSHTVKPTTVKPTPKSKSHETMLIGVSIGAAALATYLFT